MTRIETMTKPVQMSAFLLFAVNCVAFAQPATQPSTAPATRTSVGQSRTSAITGSGTFDSSTARSRDANYPLRHAVDVAPITDAEVAQQASCLIQVEGGTDANDDGSRQNIYPVAALANTTALLDPLAKEVLNLSPEQRRDLIRVAAAPLQPRFVSVEVVLKKSDQNYAPDAAQRFLARLCDSIKASLEESISVRAKSLANRRAKLMKDLEGFKAKQETLREKIRTARSKTSSNYNYGDRQSSIQNVKQQIQQSETELNRLRNRLKAIDPSSAPLVAEWTKMIDLREQRVVELKEAMKKDKSTQAQLDDAVKSLEQARVQLASAKQAIQTDSSRRNSGDSESLRSQISEIEMRVAPLHEVLKNLEDLEIGRLIDELPEMQNEEQQLRSNIQGTMQRLAEFDRNTRDNDSVIITVIDGQPDRQ